MIYYKNHHNSEFHFETSCDIAIYAANHVILYFQLFLFFDLFIIYFIYKHEERSILLVNDHSFSNSNMLGQNGFKICFFYIYVIRFFSRETIKFGIACKQGGS